MLKIIVPARKFWDYRTEKFVDVPETILLLEHSLSAISEWEQKWHKPFLKQTVKKTPEEKLDYIRCMTLNSEEIPLAVYTSLTEENAKDIEAYIEDSRTALTFHDKGGARNAGPMTNEILYWQMSQFGIPPEYDKWHLNHLIALLRVCINRSSKPKKMKPGAIRAQNDKINAARRKALHSKG